MNEGIDSAVGSRTSIASLALQIAHRGYVLQTGRVVLSGKASELQGDQRIWDAYLGGALAVETAS